MRVLFGIGLAFGMMAAGSLPASAHLSIIRQGPESRGAIETGDRHGYALAAGDFNGDGYDDLASGAPFEDLSTATNAGAVIVSFGTQYGLTHVGADLLQQSDFGLNSTNDEFGYALTAGDFNEDGYDDLAVGAPGADLGLGGDDIGGVFVYQGSASGLFATHDLTQGDAGGSHEAGDRFGASLCTGDFNQDGAADIGVGCPGEDGLAGAAFWFSGGLFGLVSGPQGYFKQSSLGGTNSASDGFGTSVAAGQVLGSSHDDLIIGTPYKDVSSLGNAGAVYVVSGSATGLNAATRRTYTAAAGDLGGPQASGLFGYAVAAGHLYTGSWDGLAISEPGRHASVSAQFAGRVVVGKGGNTDVDWNGAESIVLTQSDASGVVIANEYFGMAMAAGHYDVTDSYEDLAVGAPRDRYNSGSTSTGWVGVFYGGSAGPTGGSWNAFYQNTCNETVEDNDDFGTAVCFGEFDGTGNGNLAAGAPGEDADAGMVHVIAPWRQHFGTSFKTQLAVDCEGKYIFSAKPFDEVCIASTTKAMTVLIACERAQLPPSDPKHVPLSAVYTVPEWIRTNVGGSLYNFRPLETLTLRDLLYCCIFPSGNDASYAIADLLTGSNNSWNGQYAGTCQDFVDEMNDRAAELGMNDTYFTNPPGLDVGDHHSTAADMAKLGRAAMNNTLMKEVVGSTNYWFSSGWYDTYWNEWVTEAVSIDYGWLQGLKGFDDAFRGVKPGGTPCAQRTAVMAAESPAEGMAIATAFGSDSDLSWSTWVNDLTNLMQLGVEECGWSLNAGTGGAWRWGLGNLLTSEGSRMGGGASFGPIDARAPHSVIELFRTYGNDEMTSMELDLSRSADMYFEPNQTLTFGIGPFQSHDDIVFINNGEANARLRVTPSYGAPLDFNLDPGERAVLPAFDGALASFSYAVQNQSGGGVPLPMNIGVLEQYRWIVPCFRVADTPFFAAQIERPGLVLEDAFRMTVTGLDPIPGQEIYATLHDEGVVVEVDGSGQPDVVETPRTVLVSAGPNPFAERTELAFHLRQSGDAALSVYDAQGREVRRFTETAAEAGGWNVLWDGRDTENRPVAQGVYFYQLTLDGQAEVSGRVNVVR